MNHECERKCGKIWEVTMASGIIYCKSCGTILYEEQVHESILEKIKQRKTR